jgi:hypothetical protein
MLSFVAQAPGRGPRVPFLIWGWAMLFVVLLSATPTGGQVRSRLVGSAFDPTTVSVALGPKQPKAKVFAKASAGRLPDTLDDVPPTGGDPAILSGAVGPGRAVLEPLADFLPFFRSYAGLSAKAHGARAPPFGCLNCRRNTGGS